MTDTITIPGLPQAPNLSLTDLGIVSQAGITRNFTFAQWLALFQSNEIARPYLTLEQFGGGTGQSAALNNAALITALAFSTTNAQNGNVNSIPLMGNGGVYNISASVALTTGMFMTNINLNMITDNIPILVPAGAGMCVRNVFLTYMNMQTSSDSNAIGILLGSTNFVFYSEFDMINIQNAYISIGTNNASQGEFQNYWGNLKLQFFSFAALYLNKGSSGSVFNNVFIHNSKANPSSSDCSYAVFMEDYNNFVFNFLDIESCNPSVLLVNFNNECSGVINSYHIEHVTFPSSVTVINQLVFNCGIVVNNMCVQNNVFSGNYNLFYCYSAGSATGKNTLQVNCLLIQGNTYTGKLNLFVDDGNGDHSDIYLYGLNFNNVAADIAGVVQNSRTSIRQFQNFTFESGMVTSGLVGTTPPSGGMPAPFAGFNGTALPWVQGDEMKLTNVSAGGPAREYCVTGGSPGTWKAGANIAA